MKFEEGKSYTHKRMLDCVIYVRHVAFESDEVIKLKVSWFNNRGMSLRISESINIREHEFNNWYEFKGESNA
jgi:hypothetical protein